MFDAIFNLLNRAASLDQSFATKAMDNDKNKALIIELNTIEQMYEKGLNADGEPMGYYSGLSVQMKTMKGQRTDHITGLDTGEMYASEKVEFLPDGSIKMTMDTIKDGKDISKPSNLKGASNWGVNIVGLTDNSIRELKPDFKDDIIKDLREFL